MKFYRISNEENNSLITYRTGRVDDPIPFNPENFGTGGWLFSREDILGFIPHGNWIREVTIPEDAQVVQETLLGSKVWRASSVIFGEKREIDEKVIQELIDEGANVHAGNNIALRRMASLGRSEVVRVLLLNGADVHAKKGAALYHACYWGHSETVRILLKFGASVHFLPWHPLRSASERGHTEVVKLLLEHEADASANDNEALRNALENGHVEVVSLLKQYGAKL